MGLRASRPGRAVGDGNAEWFEGDSLAAIGGFIGFVVTIGIMYWVREYILYLVKAGHIAVMVELFDGKTGLPGGKGQIDYAQSKVRERFLESSILFGLDQLASGLQAAAGESQSPVESTVGLFIVIPSQLELSQLGLLDWRLVLFVVAVLFLFLGLTNSLFVGVAIPFSMLISFVVIGALGLTLNMVVLFSLIMSVGMLVDGAIVVTELADRAQRAEAEALTRADELAVVADFQAGITVLAT